MSKDNEAALRTVFYSFLFFLIGVFIRQVSTACHFKTSYYGLLFLIGVLFGLLSYRIKHLEHAVIDKCGPGCLQSLFIPIYFFEGGFLVDNTGLKPRHLVLVALFVIPMWIFTGIVIALLGAYVFPFDHDWNRYVIVFLFALTPDVQSIKFFFGNRYTDSDSNLSALLAFEGLTLSAIVSMILHTLLNGRPSITNLKMMPFTLLVTIIVGVLIGKAAAFWVKRILNDIIIQTTICFAVIFITFSLTVLMGLYPGLAVLAMGVAMMRQKPTIPKKTIEFICKFAEISRVALISILTVVAGMELVQRLPPLFSVRLIAVSVVIYIVHFALRFIVLCGAWYLRKPSLLKGFHDVVMLGACNIRGPFNIVMSFGLILRFDEFIYADDRLFIMATIQIVMSFFVTVPIANVLFHVFQRYDFDFERLTMICRGLKFLKEIKTSFMDILKKISFTADADWDTVADRTRIKKIFRTKYNPSDLVPHSIPENSRFIEQCIRRDSIRMLLRTQSHLMKEQFEQGLITSHTARQLARVNSEANRNRTLMTVDGVMKMTSPNKHLLKFHQELVEDLNEIRNRRWNIGLWILISWDGFLNLWGMMGKLCTNITSFGLADEFIWIYNVVTVVFIAVIFVWARINKPKHNWTLLLLITIILGTIWALLELFASGKYWVNLNFRFRLPAIDKNMTVDHISVLHFISISLSFFALCTRIMAIGYCLPVFKKCLANFSYSALAQATYVQCEALESFLHIMQDSIHYLPDSLVDENLTESIQVILHRQILGTRQYLGVFEIISPSILTALKTYIISRLSLNSSLKMVTRLKDEGFLSVSDVVHLNSAIRENMRILNHLSSAVKPPPIKHLLADEPFMRDLVDFPADFFENFGEIRSFKPGETLINQGVSTPGLFIILGGLVRSECVASQNGTRFSKMWGHHTYHDNPLGSNVDAPDMACEVSNFYSRGTILGERPFLTGKLSHKTMRAVTRVQALLIKESVIREKLTGPALTSLEQNLWRETALRISARLIQSSVSSDKGIMTRRKVYHILEHSILEVYEAESIINLDSRRVVAVILINGLVWGSDNDHPYMGPAFIPPRMTQPHMKVGKGEQAILLVIPDADQHGLPTEGDWTNLRYSTSEMDDLLDELSELTPSSASSDGMPHQRFKETLRVVGGFQTVT